MAASLSGKENGNTKFFRSVGTLPDTARGRRETTPTATASSRRPVLLMSAVPELWKKVIVHFGRCASPPMGGGVSTVRFQPQSSDGLA